MLVFEGSLLVGLYVVCFLTHLDVYRCMCMCACVRVLVCASQDGTCALFSACECGATKAVRMLLAASANPSVARMVRGEVHGGVSLWCGVW